MADGENISADSEDDKALIGNITPKQLDLLRFMRTYIEEHGYAPSFDEMAAAMELASKSGIARLVDALVHRGYIVKEHQRARGIDITTKGLNKTRRGI